MSKMTGTLLKIGSLVGAVALQEFLRPKLSGLASGVAIAPKSMAGLADDFDFYGGDPSSDPSYSDVPSDVLVPYNPGMPYYDPSQGAGLPYAVPYQPAYPSYYPQYQQPVSGPSYGPSYGPAYNPAYGPSYQYGNYPTPGTTYPAYNPSPISNLVANLFPTVATIPLTGQEAANDSAVQYGISTGVLKQVSCVGSSSGLSPYHNCMFTVQTSRGAKTINFKTAAAVMKKYQRTGKL